MATPLAKQEILTPETQKVMDYFDKGGEAKDFKKEFSKTNRGTANLVHLPSDGDLPDGFVEYKTMSGFSWLYVTTQEGWDFAWSAGQTLYSISCGATPTIIENNNGRISYIFDHFPACPSGATFEIGPRISSDYHIAQIYRWTDTLIYIQLSNASGSDLPERAIPIADIPAEVLSDYPVEIQLQFTEAFTGDGVLGLPEVYYVSNSAGVTATFEPNL